MHHCKPSIYVKFYWLAYFWKVVRVRVLEFYTEKHQSDYVKQCDVAKSNKTGLFF